MGIYRLEAAECKSFSSNTFNDSFFANLARVFLNTSCDSVAVAKTLLWFDCSMMSHILICMGVYCTVRIKKKVIHIQRPHCSKVN